MFKIPLQIFMKMKNLLNLKNQFTKVLTRGEMKNVIGGMKEVEPCCLITEEMNIILPGRENDPEYCERLCDNAPGCLDLC